MDLKEFDGFKGTINDVGVAVQEEEYVDETGNTIEGEGLIVEIEAIHETITSNFTRYSKRAMKEGLSSWTTPYNKPVIEHHDEEKGSVIGRVLKAEFRETGEAGLPCVVVTALITDEEAIKKIEDGRLLTTSIGARADNVRCSICNHHIVSEKTGCPKHARGSKYNGELCVWDINDMYIKEISYVVVPSDKFSKNTRILKKSSVKSGTFSESTTTNNKGGSPAMDKTTGTGVNVSESEQQVEAQTTVNLTEAEQLAQAEQTILELKESAQQADALRAEAENQVAAKETELRTVLLQALDAVATASGKGAIDHEKLMKRSVDSLKDKLADELEEFQAQQKTAAKEEPQNEIPVTDHGKVASDVNTTESETSTEDPSKKEEAPDETPATVETKESATDIPKATNPSTVEDKVEDVKIPSNIELKERFNKLF